MAAAGIAVAFLIVLLIIYAPATYNSWRESRLLKRATKMLHEQKLDEAAFAAHEALRIKGDSLPAFNVLAEVTEKENKPETVAWRAQIARLLPKDLASQLNLVSAALRFGQLDVARKALEHVSPNDRDKAAYHVVAGWLARAQGKRGGRRKSFCRRGGEGTEKRPLPIQSRGHSHSLGR